MRIRESPARALHIARFAVLLVALLPSAPAAGQIPPAVEMDRFLLQAEQAVRDRNFVRAEQVMGRVLTLQAEHNLEPAPEDHVRYAKVWKAVGDSERAGASVTAYLEFAGREAEHYGEALDLLSWVEFARTVLDTMEFVRIAPGTFQMGSTSDEADDDEKKVTRVRIREGFWLGKYEVTQAEWEAVMGWNPSWFSGCARCPVERVSWEDVQEFIDRVNARSGQDRYRLPTEAEWEYAARAGTSGDRYLADLNEIAWYRDNGGDRTHPVGGKRPNSWGLHDMLGNVWEWVADWYGDYPGGSVTDPRGAASGSYRVDRGCSWGDLRPGLPRSESRASAPRATATPGWASAC